jgi:hypothetical protein
MGLASLLGEGLGSFAEKIGGVVDRFVHSKDEKAQFMLEMEKLLQQRDSEIEKTIQKELDTAARVIEAEMNQDDKYTKRTRPTIVYAGLAMFILNSVVLPKLAVLAAFMSDPTSQAIIIEALQPVAIDPTFILSWGGVVAIYAGGRTLEKRGARSAGVQAMTGNGGGITGILQKALGKK